MSSIIRSRPSPAIVVAIVALVAVLAGTALAGPGASTSAKAITKSKVKKIANTQATKAVQSIFPITSADLGTINTRTATASINGGATGEATANCQAGEKVISGGSRGPSTFPVVLESHKQGEGWRVRAFNNTADNNQTLTVEAYCLAP
jgi:hypothetical protein